VRAVVLLQYDRGVRKKFFLFFQKLDKSLNAQLHERQFPADSIGAQDAKNESELLCFLEYSVVLSPVLMEINYFFNTN
jgi:hypothetical protein